MKWSITQLRKYQNKPFTFSEMVDFNHLIEELELINLSEIHVEGRLEVKSNEVVAHIHVRGQYTMPCARTLQPVETPLDVETTEIFDLEGYYDDGEDEHYHDATDGMINLRDIVEEIIIVEKPMRVFSNDSNQMLRGGNGWDVIDEDQLESLEDVGASPESKQVDPRLQKLQQLYDEKQ